MDKEIPPRLHWACRRGMLELDVLLGNFLREAYLSLSAREQENFILLLQCNDQELFMWLTGKDVASDPGIQTMVEKVRHHAKTRHSTTDL